MKVKIITVIAFMLCHTTMAQTYDISFSGSGDLTMKLGRYKIGISLDIVVNANGSSAEDGGVYHITSDWGALPKVTYRGESSINDRLKFYGYVDPTSIGYCFLFATWDNRSPSESSSNLIKFFITSKGNIDTANQNGNFAQAVELATVLSVNSYSSNVGIGTSIPSEKLELVGKPGEDTSIKLTHQNEASRKLNLKFEHDHGGTGSGIGLIQSSWWNDPGMLFQISRDISNMGFAFQNNAGSELMRIVHNGNVGIGTTTPSNKLEVNGTVRAKEVKIKATPWPDYVFSDTYRLSDLSEVSDYIDDNGHLPNIPSAAEVEENGIKLGEMNAKLLEKIEELTLYLIAEKERNDRLEKRIEVLEAK